MPSVNAREESEEDALQPALEEMTGVRGRAAGEGPPSLKYRRRTDPVREGRPWSATMCFPTLFPKDTSDPFGYPGQRAVSLAGAATYLMRFVDRPHGAACRCWLGSHRTFRYWCLT